MVKLARQMEWRKETAAALCLWIGTNNTTCTTTTSLAIGWHHPSNSQQAPTTELLRIGGDGNPTIRSLQHIIHEHSHLPLIVGWPLQHEARTCGAACGKVLHVLDRIEEDVRQQQQQQHRQRTLTLYTPPPPPAANNSNNKLTPLSNCHVASREQYQQHAFAQHDVQSAADLWHLICTDVWPQQESTMEEHSAEDDDWGVATSYAASTTGLVAAATPPRRSLVQAAA